jgi:hypothetical protein
MKKLVTTAAAWGVLGLIATGAAVAAAPNGNAYGYWAGRLCDHIGPTTAGVTYWESRGYESRGACVRAEGQSLKAGEWDPADWPI